MKTFIRVLAGLMVLAALPAAFFGFVYLSARNSRDCRQMVIDSYELRTGIDIPAVEAVNCYFDPERQLRISVYGLRVPAVGFAQRHSLQRTAPAASQLLHGIYLLGEGESPASGAFYGRSGRRQGDCWAMLVEVESGRMWVEVDFTN